MPPLFALALAATAAPPADIVVRGRRTEAALAQCLARGCATPDDVRLSMARAEAQFAQGAYRDARDTLARALDRNRQAAARYPRMVAALYEASATVNLHYGDREAHRRGMIGQATVLRGNLPADDPQVLLLAIQLGDYYAQRRDWRTAERQYAVAREGYAARGEQRLAALAALRAASLALARENPGLSETRLGEIARMPAAHDPVVAQASAVLGARIAASRGEQAGIESLLATLRTDPAAPPVLLHQDPHEPDAAEASMLEAQRLGLPDPAASRWGDAAGIRWADIGFMVAADGSVSDVEVLRGNRQLGWTAPHLKRVANRRYAPLALAAGQPGVYRIERFTLRARRIAPTGSLIRQAAGSSEVEVLDLTRSEARPPG